MKQVKILLALSVLLSCFVLGVGAVNQPLEIKVGYVSNYGTIKAAFSEGAEGFGYEYLNDLLGYMDGDYTLTFVDCSSMQDCMDKLDSGEIDIAGPTIRYDELDYIYTEHDLGSYTFMLATLSATIEETDPFEGATIGVPDYYLSYDCLAEFLEEEGVDAQVVSVPSKDLNVGIGLGNIDFVLMSSLQTQSGLTIATGLDAYPVYFIASPERQQLIDEMDSAMERLQEAEPLFQSQLALEYSSYNFTTNAYISETNAALVREKGVYYVGIRNFSSALIREGANGELEGVAFTLLDMLSEKAGVTFECVLLGDSATQADYDRTDFVIAATDYTADIGFPSVSSSYLDLPFVLLEHREDAGEDEEGGALERIGVAKYYRTDDLMVDGTLYGREVVKYDTVQGLQEAFDAGEIDCMLITVASLNMLRNEFETQDYVATTVDATLQLCLAFSEDMSNAEMTVFNKLISTIDQAALETAVMEFALNEEETTFGSYISKNPWVLMNFVFITLLVGVVVAVVAEYRRRILLAKRLNVDELTGLSSNRKFVEDARRVLKNDTKNQYNFISLDIDNFKYINEMYGYEIGSRLLQLLAEFIRTTVLVDTLLCRSSGDNFLLMAPIPNSVDTFAQWKTMYDQLQQRIEDVLQLPCRISFSVGVYEITDPTLDVNVMIDYANIARHMGKETTGFTYHYFTEEMAANRIINNEITTAMVPAIKDEEFVLYYQPKLDLNTEAVVGAEVLVRWTRGNKVMPPNYFIPLFEKNGFIETLDYYVLNHTCMFLQQHSQDTIPRLSVNLSSVSMLQPDVVRNILDILAHHGVKPPQLDLEITETAFVENGVVLERLGELRGHGFTISMDDFGTGVSSLNRLKNMELDTLKIDREFIIDSLENTRGNQILRYVMQMARGLKLETVAEGIETEAQCEFLKNLGCDVGQGYFFACPLPEEEFLQYCSTHYTKEI